MGNQASARTDQKTVYGGITVLYAAEREIGKNTLTGKGGSDESITNII